MVYPKENRKGCRNFEDSGTSLSLSLVLCPLLFSSIAEIAFALKVWNAQNAGAAAVLVADDVDERLITMDSPEADGSSAKYIENITIPSALIEKNFAEKLKKAVSAGEMVNVNLD